MKIEYVLVALEVLLACIALRPARANKKRPLRIFFWIVLVAILVVGSTLLYTETWTVWTPLFGLDIFAGCFAIYNVQFAHKPSMQKFSMAMLVTTWVLAFPILTELIPTRTYVGLALVLLIVELVEFVYVVNTHPHHGH